MPGTFSPDAEFKGKRGLAIPACITARASRTCRDACRDCLPTVAGKTFPAFPAHAHPQFYVFGKWPMVASSRKSSAQHIWLGGLGVAKLKWSRVITTPQLWLGDGISRAIEVTKQLENMTMCLEAVLSHFWSMEYLYTQYFAASMFHDILGWDVLSHSEQRRNPCICSDENENPHLDVTKWMV